MSRFRDYFVSKVVALLVNSPLEIYLRNTPEFCELGLEKKLSFDLYMSINENDLGLSLDAYLLERQSRRVRWSLRREWHHSSALEQANILCEQICAAVRENMLDGPNIYFARSETENIAALIAFHGGLMSHRKFTRDNNLSSRTQAMEAIKHDPDFSSGWSLLARCFVAESRLGWSDAPRESLRLGHEAALRAVDLNPRSAEAWSALGLIRLHQHDHEAALKCSSKVLDLSSACPESIALSAMIENYCGRYDIGLSQIEQAISGAPCCPGYFHGIKMVSLRMQDRIQEAIVAENVNLEKNPINPCSDLRLSVAFSQLGDVERAKTHTKKALYKNPAYSKNCLVYTEPYRAEKETMRYISYLFKAGLPSS